MWISSDSGMPNLPHFLDSLTQSKKKGQAILFCPIKQGFNACTTSLLLFINGFYVIFSVKSDRLHVQLQHVGICSGDDVSCEVGI